MTDKDGSVTEQDDVTTNEQEDLSDEEKAKAELKEAISVETEDTGSLRKRLTITVPHDLIAGRLSEQYDELKRDAQVPGFRKGHAPIKLIEKRFGTEVGDQITASLISGAYLAAIEKESINVLGDPLMCVKVKEKRTGEDGVEKSVEVEKLLGVDDAIEHVELPVDGPLVFSCEVDLKPEFKLPSLEKIPVKKPKLKITKKDVDTEIKRIMALRGTFRPVENATVETDDLLVGNLKVIVDGETVDSEDDANLSARDQRYDGLSLEGFGKASLKKKVGDTITIQSTVPDDYDNVDVRGKDATIEFSILDVKRLDVPKLDAEALAAMGFDSEKEFHEFVKDRMEGEVSGLLKQGMQAQITEYLFDKTELELPSGLSQRQTDRIVNQQMMELYSKGTPDADIGKKIDELRTAAQEEARQELKYFFIMDKVAEERDITATEEELNGTIAQIAQRRGRRFDRVRDEIISHNQLGTLYLRIRNEKILQMLMDDAEITETDVPKKDSGKAKTTKADKQDKQKG